MRFLLRPRTTPLCCATFSVGDAAGPLFVQCLQWLPSLFDIVEDFFGRNKIKVPFLGVFFLGVKKKSNKSGMAQRRTILRLLRKIRKPARCANFVETNERLRGGSKHPTQYLKETGVGIGFTTLRPQTCERMLEHVISLV